MNLTLRSLGARPSGALSRIAQLASACLFVMLLGAGQGLRAQNNEALLANEYFNDGEYDKALELYNKLHKQEREKPLYIYRIADSYMKLERFEEAKAFAEHVSRKQQDAPQYEALIGEVLYQDQQRAAAEKRWRRLIQKELKQAQDFERVGQFFRERRRYKWAEKTYLAGRSELGQKAAYAKELGQVYEKKGEFGNAAREFVRVFLASPGAYKKMRTRILGMTSEQTARAIEPALLQLLQQHNKNMRLRELIYDFYLQSENYREALVQARSLNRLGKENGKRLFKLAQTLQKNSEYELSNEALDYITDNNKDSPYYLKAFFQKAKNFELKAFEERPVDSAAVRQAVRNYQRLFDQYGRRPRFSEAMYRKARLLTFHLNDLDSALSEIAAIEKLTIQPMEKADARLLKGDIYVMQGRYSDAELLYKDLSDQFNSAQIGAQSKFHMARLNYFRGDFSLAKAQLKILKDNASNNISNDAIDLFLRIEDNMGLDTSKVALQRFAAADLLIYQNRYDTALTILDSLRRSYPDHRLVDEILWEKANIYLDQGHTDRGLQLLDQIIAEHSDGILADDALFTKGKLYQESLEQPDKAKEHFMQILMQHPSSLYKVEARKRIRDIRGDGEAMRQPD